MAIAKKQVGANPTGMSYMVGFGAQFLQHVHHRGVSLPSVRDYPACIDCDQGFGYLHSPDPDRNVVIGVVIGGPDSGDQYTDSCDNYAQAEPATYTNVPLVGVLAFFAAAGRSYL
jgi:hypothetical protein